MLSDPEVMDIYIRIFSHDTLAWLDTFQEGKIFIVYPFNSFWKEIISIVSAYWFIVWWIVNH